ncbi:MAG TPA: polysaccharide deacetylase family protein [Spirochaetaceae bacterium]|nr:polysaccharide deacetylase family protein [Spirochaetaceae bacterium]
MTKTPYMIVLGLVLSLAAVREVRADMEFLAPDIAPDDTILFSTRVDLPGGESYDTLFAVNAASPEPVQLSFYPEALSIVDDGRRLQIRNRFGVFMTERGFSGLKPVAGFPSFTRGASVQQGKMVDARPAPDGSLILYIAPTGAARGDLMLFDITKSTNTIIAKGIAFSIDTFPAAWSLDSRYFVYSRNNELFYFSIEQARANRIPDESWRRIGKGRIAQVRWSANGSLYVLRERSMYRIMPEEFFTQAIYSGIVAPGSLVGKAPFPYDPNFDAFWISPDGGKVLLCKDGRNIFLYRLDPDDYGQSDEVRAMPYLFLQGNTVVNQIIWPASDEVTIFTGSIRNGERVSGAYRVKIPLRGDEGLSASFQELDVAGARLLTLSPDETRIAIAGDSGVSVRRYSNWATERNYAAPGALSALWVSNDRLVIAGKALTELVSLSGDTRTLIALSQADAYGWAKDKPGSAMARVGQQAYEGSPLAAAWQRSPSYAVREPSTSSANYRVYLDALSSGAYKNLIMLRSIKTLGTTSLLPKPGRSYVPFPDRDDPREPGIFNHGSRIRRREVALVINAHEGAEGLVTILNALKAYEIRSTFFLNGEFIRRNPGAARLVAQSGHETGNLFFSVFDATDARYRIDAEFVKRGLARNEDEYFQATGAELSLLWHAPYYATSSVLLEAASSMHYSYIGRDIDPLDWVGRFQGSVTQSLYASAHDLVERIMASVRPGSIIPIQLGIPEGGRDDFLFNELPLLINALMAEGYTIVPVSQLIEYLN